MYNKIYYSLLLPVILCKLIVEEFEKTCTCDDDDDDDDDMPELEEDDAQDDTGM